MSEKDRAKGMRRLRFEKDQSRSKEDVNAKICHVCDLWKAKMWFVHAGNRLFFGFRRTSSLDCLKLLWNLLESLCYVMLCHK